MPRAHLPESQKPIVKKTESSGWAKHERKKKIKEQNKKLAVTAARFFKPANSSTPTQRELDSTSSESSDDDYITTEAIQVSPTSTFSAIEHTAGSSSRCGFTPTLSSGTDSDPVPCLDVALSALTNIEIQSDNPVSSSADHVPLTLSTDSDFQPQEITTWPFPLNSSTIDTLLSLGPPKFTTKIFPPVNGKSFNPAYYKHLKKNGEKDKRDWLVYSEISNSLFCYPCSLFGFSPNNSGPWINYSGRFENETKGYCDFNHTKRGIERHETGQVHFQNILSWKLRGKGSRIVSLNEKQTNKEETHWQSVLRGIVDAVLYLSKNNLAFRGSSDNLQDKNCGNFLNLIKLLAKYYPPLTIHLNRLQSHTQNVSFLSHRIQNEFIGLCGSSIRNAILDKIRQRKYFSIMFDSTPDISRSEQISQVIRTVSCSKKGCYIIENFVDFLSTTEKTGKSLAQAFIDKLANDKLDLKNCRGQGYDNGSNMSGVHNGVQKWILKQCENADYVPCAAHSLNLVGVNAVEKVQPAKLVLGQIQNLFNFFSGSSSRWEILKTKVNVTLKGQSSTRWAAKFVAVSALHEQYFEVTEALIEMTNSSSLNADTVADASARLNDILNFKFMLALHIWNSILDKIQTCNNSIQQNDTDIERSEKLLEGLLDWLKEFRKTSFKICYVECKARADEFGIDPETGFEDVRRRKRKVFADEAPEPVLSNLAKFEIEFFNALVEKLIFEIENRFIQVRNLNGLFGFLWGEKLVTLEKDELDKHVKDLCTKYSNDFDQSRFAKEMEFLQNTISPFLQDNEPLLELGPLDILNILHKNELASSFPNVETALRIFLTLPISVASNERAFSRLKIIKTYLRSTMDQERLSNLAIISIEHETAEEIDFDEIIRRFSAVKSRKVNINL